MDYMRTSVLKKLILVTKIHRYEGSCQFNFVPKLSFILVSFFFFFFFLRYEQTRVFTVVAICRSSKKVCFSKHLQNSVKSPCEEVLNQTWFKTLVLNQTCCAKPPNAWLLRKDASLKTYFLHHSLMSSVRMILHDGSLNECDE